MKLIDPLLLQRLIDGEITSGEVRQLLLAARQDDSHWQSIAVALLEDRGWHSQLCDAVSNDQQLATDPSLSTLPTAANDPLIGLSVRAQPTSPSIANAKTELTVAGRSKRMAVGSRQTGWLVIAASIVLAAMLGYQFGQDRPNFASLNSLPGAEATSAAVLSGQKQEELIGDANGDFGDDLQTELAGEQAKFNRAIPSQIRQVNLRPDYHLQLPDDSDVPLQGSVPMYAVDSLDQLAEISRAQMQEFQFNEQQLAALQQQGFNVREKVEFVTGDLENGRRFLVPIRTVQFNPIYQ